MADSCPSVAPIILSTSTSTSTSMATSSNPLLQHSAAEINMNASRVRSALARDPGSDVELPPYPSNNRIDASPISLLHSSATRINSDISINININVNDGYGDCNKEGDNDIDQPSTDTPNSTYARFTIEDSGSDVEDDPSDNTTTTPLPFSSAHQSDLLSAATRRLEQSDSNSSSNSSSNSNIPVPTVTPKTSQTSYTSQVEPFLYTENGPYLLEFEETPRSSRQGSDALAPKQSNQIVPPYFHPSPSPGSNRKALITSTHNGSTGSVIPIPVSHGSWGRDDDTLNHAEKLSYSDQLVRLSHNNDSHDTGGQQAVRVELQHEHDNICTRHRDDSECELAHTRHRGASLWSYSGYDNGGGVGEGEEEISARSNTNTSKSNEDNYNNGHKKYDKSDNDINDNNLESKKNNNSSIYSADDRRQEGSHNSNSNNNNNSNSNSNSGNSNNNSSTDYEVNNINGGIQAFVPMPQSAWKTVSELIFSRTFWRFSAFTLLLVNLKTVFRHLDATLPTYLVRMFGENVPKGIIYSINPFMIIFLTPLVSALTSTTAHFDMIKYGSYLTAVSPFFLAVSTSIWATVW